MRARSALKSSFGTEPPSTWHSKGEVSQQRILNDIFRRLSPVSARTVFARKSEPMFLFTLAHTHPNKFVHPFTTLRPDERRLPFHLLSSPGFYVHLPFSFGSASFMAQCCLRFTGAISAEQYSMGPGYVLLAKYRCIVWLSTAILLPRAQAS